MKQGVIIELLVIQIIIILLLILLLIYVIKVRHNIALEKKFSKYTIGRLENHEISIFDKINKFISNIIKTVSNLIKKSEILSKYGLSYEKHISYDELEHKSGIDYISTKILL